MPNVLPESRARSRGKVSGVTRADPLAWIDAQAADRRRLGLTRTLSERGELRPGRIVVGGRTLRNFAANDYLGLAADPRVIAAACRSAEVFGWGSGASPLVTGWSTPHRDLAEDLADFEQVEDVALFPSGFAANLGTIAALVGPGDAVYVDRWNHDSLIAGARLSGARLRVYPHGDAARLEAILQRDRGRFRRSLIATDGVFSMDGDRAPLSLLADLAEQFGAILQVDEAHGTGVIGPDGRGAAADAGVEARVPVKLGTLSKALGSLGGFVAGSRKLVDHLLNHANSLIYSTSLPPAAASAAREALRIARTEPWRREHVQKLGDRFRRMLFEAGFEVGAPAGPIVPVIVGDPGRVVALADRLRTMGHLVAAIRPPTVPTGTARLRISLTAAHTEQDVDTLAHDLDAAARAVPSPPED